PLEGQAQRLNFRTTPPPTNTCCTCEVKSTRGATEEWPVMKSRASRRIPRTRNGVRKSTPPPNCNTPAFPLESRELKCATPPPMLAKGDTLLLGRNFR